MANQLDDARSAVWINLIGHWMAIAFIAVWLTACGGGGNTGNGATATSGNSTADTTPPSGLASQGTLALTLQPVATGLDRPLFLTAPDNDSRLFIVERPGRIRVVKNGALL